MNFAGVASFVLSVFIVVVHFPGLFPEVSASALLCSAALALISFGLGIYANSSKAICAWLSPILLLWIAYPRSMVLHLVSFEHIKPS